MTHQTQPAFPIIDLHSHLVPGVDDGTRTVAESLGSLVGLYPEGVRSHVTTPHLLLPQLTTSDAVDCELGRQRRAFDELATAAAGRTDLPELWLGQEIWA